MGNLWLPFHLRFRQATKTLLDKLSRLLSRYFVPLFVPPYFNENGTVGPRLTTFVWGPRMHRSNSGNMRMHRSSLPKKRVARRSSSRSRCNARSSSSSRSGSNNSGTISTSSNNQSRLQAKHTLHFPDIEPPDIESPGRSSITSSGSSPCHLKKQCL